MFDLLFTALPFTLPVFSFTPRGKSLLIPRTGGARAHKRWKASRRAGRA